MKVNVINNVGKDCNVTVNEKNDGIEIVINLNHSEFKLSNKLKQGDMFKDIDGDEYILWYYLENGDAVVIRKENICEMKFGNENNNYGISEIDKYFTDTYLKELEAKFGAENIAEHEVNLLSLDGENDYGKLTRKVSIPTLDEYRMHKREIKKHIKKWFWLCTPNSTPSGCGSGSVRCVDSDGYVGYGWYGYVCGVRPRFVLKSTIFESCKE